MKNRDVTIPVPPHVAAAIREWHGLTIEERTRMALASQIPSRQQFERTAREFTVNAEFEIDGYVVDVASFLDRCERLGELTPAEAAKVKRLFARAGDEMKQKLQQQIDRTAEALYVVGE